MFPIPLSKAEEARMRTDADWAKYNVVPKELRNKFMFNYVDLSKEAKKWNAATSGIQHLNGGYAVATELAAEVLYNSAGAAPTSSGTYSVTNTPRIIDAKLPSYTSSASNPAISATMYTTSVSTPKPSTTVDAHTVY
jgi:hypothetical protein